MSPRKGIFQFGKKGKLASIFVGHFQVDKRIGSIAYKLILPQQLSHIHDDYVSMLRKCTLDLTWVIDLQNIQVNKDTLYLEEPLQIMEVREHRLKNKVIHAIEVLW